MGTSKKLKQNNLGPVPFGFDVEKFILKTITWTHESSRLSARRTNCSIAAIRTRVAVFWLQPEVCLSI